MYMIGTLTGIIGGALLSGGLGYAVDPMTTTPILAIYMIVGGGAIIGALIGAIADGCNR